MQGTQSRITSWTSLLALITNAEVAKTDTSFCLGWLRVRDYIVTFFITIVTNDLAKIFLGLRSPTAT